MQRKAALVRELHNRSLAHQLVDAARFADQVLDAVVGRQADLGPATRR